MVCGGISAGLDTLTVWDDFAVFDAMDSWPSG